MQYTRFKYIAYETPTFGYQAELDEYSPYMKPGDIGELPPLPDVLIPYEYQRFNLAIEHEKDALTRLRRLAHVVDLAHSTIKQTSDRTLKVFVAPEFYFRPHLPAQSYSYPWPVRGKIVEALEGMFVHKKFKHWLFIPGTILSNRPKFPHSLYANSAIAIQGGPKGISRYIEKQQPSDIDGVPIDFGYTNPAVADNEIRQYFQAWSTRRQRIFLIDGVAIALDICLDHAGPSSKQNTVIDGFRSAKRVHANYVNEYYQKREPLLPEPVLHVLTAGGMPINTASVTAMVNGYVLRTDGHPFGHTWNQKKTAVELKKVKSYQVGISPGNLVPTEPYDLNLGDQWPPADGPFPRPAQAVLEDLAPVAYLKLPDELRIPVENWDSAQQVAQRLVLFASQPLRPRRRK